MRFLYNHSSLEYAHVMILKNLLIYLGGIFTGLFIGACLLRWFIKTGILDKELPSVEIMRVKVGKKTLYVWNPKRFGSTIHTIFIIAGWKTGLIRENSVFYEDAKVSKAISIIVVILMVIVITFSAWWIFNVISVDGQFI